jgi:putative membrane-bound dehydrogenase-like protein
MRNSLSLAVCLIVSSIAFAQGFSPQDALKGMKLPTGFSAELVAAEPMVRQPLSVSFDDRGRMWVLQYLQYPNPAGLKAIRQDLYLRTVWDRVPEPPPKGPKGIDRITILSDPDDRGRFTKSKDFLDNLNLATGFCLGNGGVYVVQPPYLFFYPDANRDDVPDRDPDVLLAGFGMEDTHSYANSLQWGPDGWLYGAHGSTVTAKITDPANPKSPPVEFQQGIWRYHPRTKRFELFSEGGGNTYGLDFDRFGRVIAGTNWGGSAMLHQMQGAYYVKGFSKHGPLHNPHTYGYFEHVPYRNFKGGHVTCGGIVYQADRYPEAYRNQYIAANLLSNAIYLHTMTPAGASYTATHGGELMETNDVWFRPIDCFQGPDGCVYVADWYDKRAAHLDPIDNWHKTSGRVYRIDYQQAPPKMTIDLAAKSGEELIGLLANPNKWWRNEARRILVERGEKATLPKLMALVDANRPVESLEALWVLGSLDALPIEETRRWLRHPQEHVRAWAVRFHIDRIRKISQDPLSKELVELAAREPSLIVRNQLACSAKRLDRAAGLRLSVQLANRSEDATDPYQRHLIWWALEAHFDRTETMAAVRSMPRIDDFYVERFARRAIAADLVDSTDRWPHLVALRELLREKSLPAMLRGMELALDGRGFAPNPAIAELLKSMPAGDPNLVRLKARFQDPQSIAEVYSQFRGGRFPAAETVKWVQLLGQVRPAGSLSVLVELFHTSNFETVRSAALAAALSYRDDAFERTVLAEWDTYPGALRLQSLTALLGKPATARVVLQQIDAKRVDPKTVPVELLRPLSDFHDETIDRLVLKHFGKIGRGTPGEKQARISWLGIQLGKGSGNAAKGHALFTKHCANCHQLFQEGARIGPDLTTADRKNRGYLLAQVVDPSGYIRPEYVSHSVLTGDGRRLSGIVGESTETSVTLVNVVENKAVKTVVSKKDIEEMLPSATSLMPEKILDSLSDEEVRDLFAYLQREQPLTPAKKEPAKEENRKLKVLLISGSLEYKSDDSLAAYQKFLEANFAVECHRAFRKADDDLPGLDALETCDVALFFTRRLTIKGDQLERVKKYVLSGKPVVAVRTASHGFQNWLEIDKEVLGGNYKNHYGAGPKTAVAIPDAAKDHPILRGVKPFESVGSLYRNTGLKADTTLLMTGTIPDHTEPITWVREYKGARIFTTSLGHPKDFEDPNFLKLLTNALFWTAKRDLK